MRVGWDCAYPPRPVRGQLRLSRMPSSKRPSYSNRGHRIAVTVKALWNEEVDWLERPADVASIYRFWPYRFPQ